MNAHQKQLLAHVRPPAFILKSETTDEGTRYIILDASGAALWDIKAHYRVAARYAQRLGLRAISPLDYLAMKRQPVAV